MLEGLLAGIAVESDRRASDLGAHFDALVQLLLEAPEKVSPEGTMKLINSFARLHRHQQGEARRTAELLAKILRPASPTVKVTASNAQVNLAAVDLGGDTAK